jgi:hypothetical protein
MHTISTKRHKEAVFSRSLIFYTFKKFSEWKKRERCKSETLEEEESLSKIIGEIVSTHLAIT